MKMRVYPHSVFPLTAHSLDAPSWKHLKRLKLLNSVTKTFASSQSFREASSYDIPSSFVATLPVYGNKKSPTLVLLSLAIAAVVTVVSHHVRIQTDEMIHRFLKSTRFADTRLCFGWLILLLF